MRKELQSRMDRPRVKRKALATASKVEAGAYRRRGVPKLPYPRQMFATIRNHEASLYPDICLWGVRSAAEANCDPDERVCMVRVEVLEILPESSKCCGEYGNCMTRCVERADGER